MASMEGPQPSQDSSNSSQAQIAEKTDGPPVQEASENIAPVSNPGNVNAEVDQIDNGSGSESVADDEAKGTEIAVEDGKNSVQKLKDRVDGLEQRLRHAGLLEDFKDQTQSKAAQDQELPSETLKINEAPKLIGGSNGTKSQSSPDETENNRGQCESKGSLKEENGPGDSVQILWDRLDSLEKRLEDSGHLKDKPAADKPRLPAIPELHYIEWSEFKNKLAGEEKRYAIEVLIGGAKYYHQRSEEERKNKQKFKDHNNDRDQLILDHKKSGSLPERIRINSKPIILIMNQIDVTNRPEYPIVMLRPFKPLFYHEARVREVFQSLCEKWGTTKTETVANQDTESTVGKGIEDKAMPALSNGPVVSLPAENDAQANAQTYPPSTAKSPQSSLPIANGSIQQSKVLEAEKDQPQAVPKIESKDGGKEETEDLSESLEALRDLRCLIEFIDVELKPVADSYRDMTRQKVPFCDLWLLFKPGDFLYSPRGNKQAPDNIYVDGRPYPQQPDDRYQEVLRIACTTGGRNHLEETREVYAGIGHKSRINAFLLSAYWVDFNATRFISRSFVYYLIPFPGERDITSLECYPLRYVPKADMLKSKWKARGEQIFREYTTFKYRYYTGKTLTCDPDGYHGSEDEFPKHAENIDSQVVVDFREALEANPTWRPAGGKLTLDSKDAPGELSEDYPTSYWKDNEWKILDKEDDDELYEDDHIDTKLLEEFIERDSFLRDHPRTQPAGNGALDENHLMLLPNRVFAFVMKNRKWALLTIDGLRSVKRYDAGFKDLQLPIGHKRTIGSLVKNHFNNRNSDLDDVEASYDADLVRGKGKGLVILLHGAPGVGKTSTAETVADAFGKILMPITCGDLGLTAAHVESELSEKFHLAELWDCVLLLDEADVFLARRTNSDIKRNSLVSVFLRMLEYFTGILFLTTNRVGAFDEAFKSRIHISLYYPPLDEEKTCSIWKVNLERLSERKQRRNEPIQFNERDIYAYARSHFADTAPRGTNWNGRQIRNAFQTASALAEFEAQEKNKKAKARSVETGQGFVQTNPQLMVRHFEEIAWASSEFDKYISGTKGFTEAEIAYREGQRMDDYRPSRRLARASEREPSQSKEARMRVSTASHGPGPGPRPRVQAQATPASRRSDSRDRQMNFRPPVSFTYDAVEGQDFRYDQPPSRRETNPLNSSGVRTGARAFQGGIASSRPKTAQHPSTFATHDPDRQRQVVFEQSEYPYEYEDEEDLDYDPLYPGSLSQPMGTHPVVEETSRREVSPRRRPVGDFAGSSRKPAASPYVDDYENEDDAYDR